MFIIGVAGGSLAEVSAAVGRLASCELHWASQLPHQAALQPQGWLAQRCVCYHDAGSDTLWVGVAAPAGAQSVAREEAREQEATCTRALLLVFLTSHAVLWLQHAQQRPAPLLPRATDLLSRLRMLQQLKSMLVPGLLPLLGVPPEEANAAVPGLCIPQLLLLVQQRQQQQQQQQNSIEDDGGGVGGSDEAPAVAAAAAAAQAAAEQQLRLLMKRCRVVLPEDTARALCTLPASGPALLLLPESLGSGSQGQVVTEALAELLSAAGPAAGGSTAPAAQTLQGKGAPAAAAAVAAALASHRLAVAGMAAGSSSAADLARWRQAVATLAAVLEAAALKAPFASISRSSSSGSSRGASKAEKAPPLPGGGAKAAAAAAAAAAAGAGDVAVPPEAAAAAAWQEACGDGVRQFSLASCKRAAAVAADAYRRNTPPLLPAAGHAAALQAALRLYCSLARGPAAADGAQGLQQQLDAYWRDGHQQCDAVSFLGSPCCLPAHDPQQQAHTSGGGGGASGAGRQLLLASGSGGQQHSIPEPFTVAELQRAAAAVASDSASAAARAQFYVRRAGGGSSSSDAAGNGPAVAGAVARPAAPPSEAAAGGDAAAEEGGGTAAGAGAAAAGCWLELHQLGPRSQWKSAALAAALLLDGQPGWLGSGGCTLATLPLLVEVPHKAGQPVAAADEVQQAATEEFPSLAEVKQQEQQQRQRLVRPAPGRQKDLGLKAKPAGAVEEQRQPRLLNWPGWQPPASAAAAEGGKAHQRASLFAVPGAAGRGKHLPQQQQQQQQQQKGGKQRGKQPQQQQPRLSAAPGAEQASLLLGVEYESVQGQRLLLTPALLAAAVQSSLDVVSVRQHAQQAAPAALGPRTAAAAAAAATTPPAAAAASLLLQDLPLWLQLPGEQLAQLGGSGKQQRRSGSSAAAAPAGGDRPPPLVWLQLRRLFVGAPEVAAPLEADPKLLLEVPADTLAPAAAAPEGAGSGSSTPGSSASGAAPVQLQYGLAAPLAIPAGCFCVLALPWLLTAPMTPASAAAGGGGGSGGPAALIRQSGPLRAVLVAQTAVRPAEAPAVAAAQRG